MANEKPQAIESFKPSAQQSTDEPVVTPAPTEAPEATPEPTSEPTVTPAPTLAPVVTPAPTQAPVVALDKQQATATTLESTIEAIMQSGNMPAKFAIAGLKRYIEGMKPGMPVDDKDVVMHQAALWKVLYRFVESTEEDFDKVFSTVLGLFHQHKDGVFNEHYVFRMMSHVNLDKEEITAFQVLVNLFKVTADPIGRQAALKQNVDISRTLANVFSENARQKILAFYGM